MKVYYSKALVANPLIINGAPVHFELLDGNRGVIELDTENPAQKLLIDGLNACVAKTQGGVSKISEAEYAEKKNRMPYSGPYRREHEQPLRPMPQQSPKRAEAAAVADVLATPAGQAAVESAVARALAKEAQAAAPAQNSPAPAAAASPAAAPTAPGEPAAPAFRPTTRRISATPKTPPATE